MTKNHPKEIFSSVTSRGAALWRSFSSLKMQQVQFETSMKNIPLGGNKEYVIHNGINKQNLFYISCISQKYKHCYIRPTTTHFHTEHYFLSATCHLISLQHDFIIAYYLISKLVIRFDFMLIEL